MPINLNPEDQEVVTSVPPVTSFKPNPADIARPAASFAPQPEDVEVAPSQSFTPGANDSEVSASEGEMPGIAGAFGSGVKEAVFGIGQTADIAQGQTPEALRPAGPEASPLEWSDIASPYSKFLPKMAFQLGASSPILGGGLVGTGVGAATTGGNPVAALAGGTLGASGMAAVQTLGPRFAEELRNDPTNPDAAYERALNSAITSGAFAGLGWAAFPIKFFQGPVKQLAFQLLGLQPGIMAGEHVTQNLLAGRPSMEGVGQTYGTGVAMGVTVAAGGAAAKPVVRFFQKKGDTGIVQEGIPTPPSSSPGGEAGTPPASQPSPVTPSTPAGGQGAAQATPSAAPSPEAVQPSAGVGGPLSPEAMGPIERIHSSSKRDDPDSLPRMPYAPEDIAEVNAILGTEQLRLNQAKTNAELDERISYWEDDRIPRYKFDDPNDKRLLTDTDLEQELAIRGNMKELPALIEVDMKKLDPTLISAELHDLPLWGSDSIIQVPGTKIPLLGDTYQFLRDRTLYGKPGPDIESRYFNLLENGLRVRPPRGHSFIYGGEVTGKRLTEMPTSKRSTHVTYMLGDQIDYMSGRPKSGGDVGQLFELPRNMYGINEIFKTAGFDRGLVGVALDMNKVPEGALISASEPIMNMAGGEQIGLKTPQEVAAFNEAQLEAQKGRTAPLLEFAKQGKFIPADLRRHAHFVVAKPIPADAWTRSSQIPYESRQARVSRRPKIRPQEVLVRASESATPDVIDATLKLTRAAQQIRPALEALYKQIGAKGGVRIIIDAQAQAKMPNGWPNSAKMYVDQGYLHVPVRGWLEGVGKYWHSDPDMFMLSMALHELGHMVTLRSFERMPASQQQSLWGAYKRALLNYDIAKDASATNPMLLPKAKRGNIENEYYLSFNEYMAEQFRRWTHGNREIRSALDQHWATGAKKLKELEQSYIEALGQEKAQQFFQSTYEFNSYMDYLMQASRGSESPLQMYGLANKMQLSYPTPRTLLAAEQAVDKAILEFKHLMTADTSIVKDMQGAVTEDMAWFGNFDQQTRNLRIMIGSLAWIRDTGELNVVARNLIKHEAVHGIEPALTAQQRKLLVEAGKLAKVLPTEAQYRKEFRDTELKEGRNPLDPETVARENRFIDSEYIAHLVTAREQGQAFTSTVDKILDYVVQTIERVGNSLKGLGFQTADDIIRAFYRGELVRRYDSQRRYSERQLPSPSGTSDWINDVRRAAPSNNDLKAVSPDTFMTTIGKPGDESLSFNFWDFYKKPKGYVDMFKRPDGEYDVEFIHVERAFYGKDLPQLMLAQVEQGIGRQLKTASILTNPGYRMISRVAPERVKYYVYAPEYKNWFSPKYIWEQVARNKDLVREAKETGSIDPTYYETGRTFFDANTLEAAKEVLGFWNRMAKKIPKAAENDPILQRQWMGNEIEVGALAREQEVAQGKILKEVLGDTRSPIESDFERVTRLTAMNERHKNAKMLDIEYAVAAPSAPEAQMMAGIFRKYGEANPQLRKVLSGTINGEADRLPYFWRKWWTLHQYSWSNPHIVPLQDYISFFERMGAAAMHWISRADDGARAWDKLGPKQRDGLTELFFWASQQKHGPTFVKDLLAEAKRLKLTNKTMSVYTRIRGDFRAFLKDIERISTEKIMRTYAGNPTGQAAALARLKAEMAQINRKPYFPMINFGKYAVTVRDPNTRKVVHFETFENMADRDRAAQVLAGRFRAPLTHEVSVGVVPDSVVDFAGLPTMLIRKIREELGGAAGNLRLTKEQLEWMERFEVENLPDKAFRRRFLAKKGTDGFSMDGIRAYSQFFRSGSRYLARLEFRDKLASSIEAVGTQLPHMKDSSNRAIIMNEMLSHFKYNMEPGRDWNKLKALFTHFQLGGSVAAASLNMTQVPLFTYPYLSSIFGEGAASKSILKNANAMKWSFGQTFKPKWATPDYLEARAEAVRQGKIQTGQAAELGAFAEGDNLRNSYAGTTAQKAIRKAGYYWMSMFSMSEQANREWVFKSAYELALKDPTNKHVVDLVQYKHRDWADIMSRTGLTGDQASAFLVAREAIDRTQHIYQAGAQAPFMRGGLPSTLQIFFSYTQQTLYALGHNPGNMKTILMLGALYGLSGLPFAEDLDNMVRLAAVKLFGKDFSMQKYIRETVNAMATGTPVDEVAADLTLNGISRYSYGWGLLPDHIGVPRFDASSNGSMGQLVPGLSPLLHAAANSSGSPTAWKDMTADVAKDVAGAGFGTIFALMQFLNANPGTADIKKWESIFPRAVKAYSKAWRYWTDEKETTRQGGTLVRFDQRDPDDVATIVAQALGFSPTKITQKNEAIRALSDQIAIIQARKLAIYSQMDLAIQQGDRQVIGDVTSGIKRFNEEMRELGVPEMGIDVSHLRSSLKARNRTRALQEQNLPNAKSQIGLSRKVFQQYPGVQ